MSIVLEAFVREQGKRSYVRTKDGKVHAVDTANTLDRGPETMVFPYSEKKYATLYMREEYVEWHETMEEGLVKHDEIAANLEKYLK